jgi:hypothetical protein
MSTENTPANETKKESQPEATNETEAIDIPTVTPDNENGEPGAPEDEESSNKGKGPKGENL